MRLLYAALMLLAGVAAANADIRINQSRYEDGNTVVAGETAPSHTVTLDDRFTTKSDANGQFKFSVKYKPETCMTDIRSGADVYSAVIAGCLDPGDVDEPLPVDKTAAHSN